MFYNIKNGIKKDTIPFVVSKKMPIFALLLINKAVNNVTNQCRYKDNKINKENKYEVRFIRHNEKSS